MPPRSHPGAVPRLAFPVVADFVDSLMNATGVVAVARAAGATAGAERARGEPPYLVYYRGSLEAGEIRGLGFEGEVSEPGAWGRLLNGGASLEVEGRRVEVLYRDLEVVEHWVAEASEGRYERDEVDGWVAGMPTYVLAGELATAEALAGELPRPELPDALRESAPEDWGRVAARALEVAEASPPGVTSPPARGCWRRRRSPPRRPCSRRGASGR